LEPVLEFARRLAASGRPIWLRYVLVPSLTDNVDDIGRLAEFAAQLGNVQRVDVLPFHQMGRFKWKELHLDYTLDEIRPPSAELVGIVCDQFRIRGLRVF
jgi:pyruvate formate lyase activating enzyme